MQYQQWLAQARAQLAGSDSPKRDAEILLGHVTGASRTRLLAFGETPLLPAERLQLDSLLARRVNGEPVAYLTGEREFWSLPLRVHPSTLIPRPDTECLVEQALQLLAPGGGQVADLGTGSGAIALALASERADCQFIGIDRIAQAVTLAQENARRLGLVNVCFACGSWYKPLQGKRYTLIVSNPPYIDADDPHLGQGDVCFEPRSALVAADAGLADLKAIIAGAGAHLLPAGWLVLEHGWQQAPKVRDLLGEAGFSAIASRRDYGGHERVTYGQWP